MKKYCRNHPLKKALSFCHICREYYCEDCLEEGVEYYYCRKRSCQEAKPRETPPHDWVISDYNKAIKLNPRHADAYYNRGNFYFYKGQIDEAISDYNKAIKLNPRHADAYNTRGVANRIIGQYDKAIADYNKTVELNPKHAFVYLNRGDVYRGIGQYDKAIADYNKFIELNPRNGLAYIGRGMAYFFKGQYDKAWNDVEELKTLGLQIDPEFLKMLTEASGREK